MQNEYQEEIQLLAAENEKLKKLNALKTDMISISAHQLRTSLSALKWILRMFLDNDLGEVTREQEGFLKRAYESNERMLQLVNDLLSFNHTDHEEIKYEFKEANITNLLKDTIFEFEGESHKKGIQILFLEPDESLRVHIDLEKIRVVVQNLIENAIKYSDSGDKVFISTEDKGDFYELSVKDTGIGIPAEDQPRIFEKFFRSKNAKEKDQQGSGLGLVTIQNIINHHQGKIWFESTEGKGTAFHIQVPKNPQELAQ